MGKPPAREDDATTEDAATSRPPKGINVIDAAGSRLDRSTRALRARLPRYEQIALVLRERIEAGELAPGQPIPSETALIAEFGVSRITVRHAVAALRAAGLVSTEHGRATRVRESIGLTPGSGIDFDPTITPTRTEGGTSYRTWDGDGWADVETPSRYRTDATIHADALGIPAQEPVFVLERQLLHASGVQIMHRTWLPFAVVDDLHLDNDPFRVPAELYQAFNAAGHELSWTDRTRAEMPRPDDVATLDIREGIPLIIHMRLTLGRDRRPLLVEETRIPADRITLVTHPA